MHELTITLGLVATDANEALADLERLSGILPEIAGGDELAPMLVAMEHLAGDPAKVHFHGEIHVALAGPRKAANRSARRAAAFFDSAAADLAPHFSLSRIDTSVLADKEEF